MNDKHAGLILSTTSHLLPKSLERLQMDFMVVLANLFPFKCLATAISWEIANLFLRSRTFAHVGLVFLQLVRRGCAASSRRVSHPQLTPPPRALPIPRAGAKCVTPTGFGTNRQ